MTPPKKTNIKKSMRIGLTGGIACGKSTAAAIFASHGCAVISADELAHAALEMAPVKEKLRERWNAKHAEIFTENGTVNRAAVAQIVFNDTAEKSWLEDIIHPIVNRGWQDFLAQKNDTDGAVAIAEIPLLFEKKLEKNVDLIVCVHCTRQTQLDRMAGRGLNGDQAAKRLESQMSLEEKMRRSDCLLFNEGAVSFLEKQITLLLTRIAPNLLSQT